MIKFKRKQERYSTERFVGVRKGFQFTYCNINGWYVVVSHKTKDIRFNTLWSQIEFKDEQEVIEWCENFNYKNFNWIGDDQRKHL